MIWAAFCADGTGGIDFVTSRMNSNAYQQVLATHLVPYPNTAGRQGYVFQHDNVPIHASRSTKQWLAARNLAVMDWPACSPDLNPIENLWGILVRGVYAGGRHFGTAQELKAEILLQYSREKIPIKKVDPLPIGRIARGTKGNQILWKTHRGSFCCSICLF